MAHYSLFITVLLVLIVSTCNAVANQECDRLVEDRARMDVLVKAVSSIRYNLRFEQPTRRCEAFTSEIVKKALEVKLVNRGGGSDESVLFKQLIEMTRARADCFERPPYKMGAGLNSLVSYMEDCAKTIKASTGASQNGPSDRPVQKNPEPPAKESVLVQPVREEMAAIEPKPTGGADLSKAEIYELATLRKKVPLLERQIDRMVFAKEPNEKQQDVLELEEQLSREKLAAKQCQDKLAQIELQLQEAADNTRDLQQLKEANQKLEQELKQKKLQLETRDELVQMVRNEMTSIKNEAQFKHEMETKRLQDKLAQVESQLYITEAELRDMQQLKSENQDLKARLNQRDEKLSAKEALVQQVHEKMAIMESELKHKTDLNNANRAELRNCQLATKEQATLKGQVDFLTSQVASLKQEKEKLEDRSGKMVGDLTEKDKALEDCRHKLKITAGELFHAIDEKESLMQQNRCTGWNHQYSYRNY